MADASKQVCFVSMPLGTKYDHQAVAEIDFDDVYRRGIVPGVIGAGMDCIRIDGLTSRGVLHTALYSAIISSPVMIADLTLNNPNVFYELGLRHASRKASTILVSAAQSRPVDTVAPLRCYRYRLTHGRLQDDDAKKLSGLLTAQIKTALREEEVDSPIFQFFPTYSVSIPEELARRGRSIRDDSERARQHLLEAQTISDRDARIKALHEVEHELQNLARPDMTLLSNLLLSYRATSAWDEMVRLAHVLPGDLMQRPVIQQQLAMALNRRNGPGDRKRAVDILQQLAHGQPDGETYGLLGRVYKDLYREAGRTEDLEAAVDAYRRGYRASPDDYYPGVNLATLLWLKGDAAGQAELVDLLPQLEKGLQRQADTGRVDYWNVATRIEIACLARRWSDAGQLVLEARLRAPADWMRETTADNLRLLAKAGTEDDRVQLIRIATALEGDRGLS